MSDPNQESADCCNSRPGCQWAKRAGSKQGEFYEDNVAVVAEHGGVACTDDSVVAYRTDGEKGDGKVVYACSWHAEVAKLRDADRDVPRNRPESGKIKV